jgi:hypothetical protein
MSNKTLSNRILELQKELIFLELKNKVESVRTLDLVLTALTA